MTSFIHVDLPKEHPGVSRFEAFVDSVKDIRQNFDCSRSLAAMLLAALASALMAVADQLIDTWADGHLLAAWVALWLVAFASLALLAPAMRQLARQVITALDRLSQALARKRADERMWSLAQKDPRIMADLCAAQSKAETF